MRSVRWGKGRRGSDGWKKAGLPWVWGFPWGFPWVWIWYGYGGCDESPWVLWVVCGDFEWM